MVLTNGSDNVGLNRVENHSKAQAKANTVVAGFAPDGLAHIRHVAIVRQLVCAHILHGFSTE